MLAELAAFPWAAIGGIGGTGMASIFFLLMYTGRILSLSTVERILQAKDEVNGLNTKTVEVLTKRVEVLTESNTTLAATNQRLVDSYGATTAYSLSEIQSQAQRGAVDNG